MRHAYKVIARFLQGTPWLTMLTLMVVVLVSVLEFLNLAVFYPVLVFVFDQKSSSQMLEFYENTLTTLGFTYSLDVVLGFFLLMTCLTLLARLGALVLSQKCVTHVSLNNQKQLAQLFLTTPYVQFTQEHMKSWSFVAGTSSIQMLDGLDAFFRVVGQVVKIALLLILMTLFEPWITLGVLSFGVFYLMIVRRLSGRMVYHARHLATKHWEEQQKVYSEILLGMKILRTLSLTDLWTNKVHYNAIQYIQSRVKAIMAGDIPHILSMFSLYLTIAVSTYVLFYYFPDNCEALLPLLGMAVIILMRLFPAIQALAIDAITVVQFWPDFEKTYGFLGLPQPVKQDYVLSYKRFLDAIVCEGVSLRLNERQILRDVSLKLGQGETTVIVGASGAGKSSLLHIILRLYDHYTGHVWVDGQELKELEPQGFLASVGYIPQERFFFAGTIRDNVTMGRKVSEEDLQEIARRAHLEEFLAQRLLGWEDILGPGALTLSGGQQQRLMIARALVNSPDIFILDEATSSLDRETEKKLEAELKDIWLGKTVIKVTHRLESVVDADWIIVMDRGTIQEQGCFETLMKKGQLFPKLYRDMLKQK